MGTRQVSRSALVAAPPERIFALLADPAQHPLIDGSGTVRASRGSAPARLSLGARFGMEMRMGAPYRIQNTVVEFEENRLIAWRHFSGHRWRWLLEPTEDGRTEVTETFDWSTARSPLAIRLLGFPKRNAEAIEKTLARLGGMFPG
ncbi:dimethyladenosine transferase [Amycolatopsis rubida]|uniref:Dimethyladenosine transferase n=1 Tax=Amycolatopsis rubida TaxID=112413 RepID=A0ABX0BZ35_9PSEU|nr:MULTISPECIES: SRPBCC family protein [Amycolatopsis]MYW94923.1 dimethyladenosine transferase [Amycolatopsis rubida]MYW95857.1 dimethyladenosine transferase [Amycolatopsis rubida]NEC59910.1 dimethyladenosine transferase [Amycolatopsis rubida]NEC60847.1 dimethyladenosine transferase [Amycolatopsis rubida]OAP26683.1 Polyketide cyclase / dehydrase and lipid transport [Amycolatopsis sp. M39]